MTRSLEPYSIALRCYTSNKKVYHASLINLHTVDNHIVLIKKETSISIFFKHRLSKHRRYRVKKNIDSLTLSFKPRRLSNVTLNMTSNGSGMHRTGSESGET